MSQSSSKNRSQKFWQAFELLKKRKAAARSGQKCTLRPDKGLLVAGGTSGHFTVVDFDVSVVAENKAGGGPKPRFPLYVNVDHIRYQRMKVDSEFYAKVLSDPLENSLDVSIYCGLNRNDAAVLKNIRQHLKRYCLPGWRPVVMKLGSRRITLIGIIRLQVAL
jgi:hypothetical protein